MHPEVYSPNVRQYHGYSLGYAHGSGNHDSCCCACEMHGKRVIRNGEDLNTIAPLQKPLPYDCRCNKPPTAELYMQQSTGANFTQAYGLKQTLHMGVSCKCNLVHIYKDIHAY